MKTIGILGGMSWESSSLYYSLINQEVRAQLGNSHSAKILMVSFDFQEIEDLQVAGDWEQLQEKLCEAGRNLKRGGADFIVLATNTMHKVMGTFAEDVGVPFLHIVDVVGQVLKDEGHQRVGLLGTRFTMEDGFYSKHLEAVYGLEVLTPMPADREMVHRIIYDELVRGVVSDDSRRSYERIIAEMVGRGAESVILGCTEIGLLVQEASCPLYDSTVLHSRATARFASL